MKKESFHYARKLCRAFVVEKVYFLKKLSNIKSSRFVFMRLLLFQISTNFRNLIERFKHMFRESYITCSCELVYLRWKIFLPSIIHFSVLYVQEIKRNELFLYHITRFHTYPAAFRFFILGRAGNNWRRGLYFGWICSCSFVWRRAKLFSFEIAVYLL